MEEINKWREEEKPSVIKRRTCLWCGKPLAIELEDGRTKEELDADWESRNYMKGKKLSGRWRYKSHGYFHTKDCAVAWANNQLNKKRQ